MKFLIDPEWADLAEDLSVEDQAEILRCILRYPEKDSKLGLWRFIRRKLDQDAIKYQEKCQRLADVRQNRWGGNINRNDEYLNREYVSSDIKSDLKSVAKSDSSSDSISNTFIKKEKVKKEKAVAVGSLLKQFSKNHRMDSEARFEITYDFSFEEIINRGTMYSPIFAEYSSKVLQKAQDSLVKKRLGQKLTLQQLTSWIEQAKAYYEQDNQ